MKKHYLAIFAFLFLGFSLPTIAQDAGRTATATWQVQKYDIDVTLPQDNARSIASRAVLTIKNISGRPATTLTLRIAPSAEVTAVKNRFPLEKVSDKATGNFEACVVQ